MRKILVLLILFAFCNGAWAQRITFIVNKANPQASITRHQLSDYFFKRNRNWPNSSPVRFFDRTEDSAVRSKFLKEYLERTSRQVEQFWIGQKLYSGDSAPTQLSSDSMVVNLVARFPGGIGYVSDDMTIPESVKIIKIEGN